jgi:hypothetical protein
MHSLRDLPRGGRLAAIGLAAALIFTASGCYCGSTNITAALGGAMYCPVGVDLGPGHISSGGDTGGGRTPLWQPAPTTVTLQFAVTSSNAVRPIEVVAWLNFSLTVSLGIVWDGTKSTGTKSIPWSGATEFVPVPIQPVNADYHLNWWIMALDARGKEVGFTCRDFPTGAATTVESPTNSR